MIISNILKNLKRRYQVFRYRKNHPNCRVGENVTLDHSLINDYVSLFDNVVLYNSNIGSYSYVQESSVLNNCEVGRFCSIAPNVVVAPGKHNPNFTSTSALFFTNHPKLPITFKSADYSANEKVIIGNDVWVGLNAVILDGVNVGDGAIIAAGSVVTKDVEPYSIVGGVPAKFIRYRFSKEDIDFLLANKWWNNEITWFDENRALLTDLHKYKEYVANHEKD